MRRKFSGRKFETVTCFISVKDIVAPRGRTQKTFFLKMIVGMDS